MQHWILPVEQSLIGVDVAVSVIVSVTVFVAVVVGVGGGGGGLYPPPGVATARTGRARSAIHLKSCMIERVRR